MKAEHVDFINRTLFLPKTKTNQDVTLPLSEVTCDLFDELAQYAKARKLTWLFQGRKGKPITYATPNVQGRQHDTRRLFTTACMNAMLSDTLIKKLRGDVMHTVHGGYVLDEVPVEVADRVTAEVLKILDIDEDAVYTRGKSIGVENLPDACDLREVLL